MEKIKSTDSTLYCLNFKTHHLPISIHQEVSIMYLTVEVVSDFLVLGHRGYLKGKFQVFR